MWLGTAGLAIWITVASRGLFTVLDADKYVPTARYAYPAMIPTMLVLVAGWRQLRLPAGLRTRLPGWLWVVKPALAWGGLLALCLASLATVATYFAERR